MLTKEDSLSLHFLAKPLQAANNSNNVGGVNAGKELVMEPLKQAAPMATLDLASSFANGHRALPRETQALLLFL
jgi:hypothetical protein